MNKISDCRRNCRSEIKCFSDLLLGNLMPLCVKTNNSLLIVCNDTHYQSKVD